MSRTLVAEPSLTRSPTVRLATSSGILRQALPDQDAAAIRDFVCRLSPRSQYLRFFAAVAPPSSGLLRALCGAAGTSWATAVALRDGTSGAPAVAPPAGTSGAPPDGTSGAPAVAPPDGTSGAPGVAPRDGTADVLLVTDGDGTVIAHGMGADERARAGLASSIGLVVADAYQRRGIGAMLLNALAGRAASRGVGSLIFEVLPANRVMLGIIGRRWPDVAGERTPDAIVFRPAIAPRLLLTARPVPSLVDLGRS